ncbi:putative transcriptional regulator containing CBS domains [Caldisphaera lagunensis DSM 15908]|uniref:Putative transcriptional regulator containing CBS domains n=2 Tax=Caldisphaera lagunensis TaxID=200415 RepID=L0AB68_CALLD|nr:putative transcriptional regulator containing CBS domains [Caldisphaera lagunensis DSM 15908]
MIYMQNEGPPIITICPGLQPKVYPKDNVSKAIQVMNETGIGAVAVIDEHGKIIGIFTERDLLNKVLVKNKKLEEVIIEDVMTKNPIIGNPSWSASKAIKTMAYYGFRHLPIVDDAGYYLCMVTIRELEKFITQIDIGVEPSEILGGD